MCNARAHIIRNMKLPISLLVLVAIKQAAPEPPDETTTPPQTVKRELYASYGQKIRPNLLGTTEPVPGIQYADTVKQAEDASSHKIVGSRLTSIPKISDLLSGHSYPFEDVVNSHLYSPISVYNLKEASNAFEASAVTPKTSVFLDELNKPSPTKAPSRKEDETHRYPSAHNTELYSFSRSRHIADPLLQSPLDLGSEKTYLQKTFQRQNSFLETSKLLPLPAQELHRFPLLKTDQGQSSQLYQLQETPNANEKSENDQDNRGGSVVQELTRIKYKKPEVPEEGFIPTHMYNSHPNGGISYASFTPIQPVVDSPKIQSLFLKQSHEPNELKTNYEQTQLFQQKVYPEEKLQQQLIPNPKIPLLRLLAVPQPQITPIYVKKGRQHLFPEYQTEHSVFEATDYHYPSTISSTTEQTNTNFKLLTEKVFRFPGDPSNEADIQNTRDIIRLLPLSNYAPVTGPLTHQKSNTTFHSPTTAKPQKLQEQVDQITQTTTDKPLISVNNLKNEESNTESPSDQAVIPLTSSSTTRRPLSPFDITDYSTSTTPQPEVFPHAQQTHTTSHNSVQVQQQELQEIHSELAPEILPLLQKNTKQHRVLEVSAKKYQRFSTPLKTTSKDDFEIEISSNIDPKQLPKDLRPVPTSQSEIQHYAERNNHIFFKQEQNLQEEQHQQNIYNQQEYQNQKDQFLTQGQNQKEIQSQPEPKNQQQLEYKPEEQNLQLQYQPGEQNQQQIQYQPGEKNQQLLYQPGEQNQQPVQYQPGEQNQQQIQYQPGEQNQQLLYQSGEQNQQPVQYQPGEQNQQPIQYQPGEQNQQLLYQSGEQNQQHLLYQLGEQNQQQLQYQSREQNPQQLQYQPREQNQQQLQYQPGEHNKQQLQYQPEKLTLQQLRYQPQEKKLYQIQYPQQHQEHNLRVQKFQIPTQPQLSNFDNDNFQNYNFHQLRSNPFFFSPVQPKRLAEAGPQFIDVPLYQRTPVVNFPTLQYFGKFSNPIFKGF